MQKISSGGLAYYTSPLLDTLSIKHGFFTRLGGVSRGPYASLNVKQGKDELSAVHENRNRMCNTLRLDAGKLVFANELGHNNRAALVNTTNAGEQIPGLDALLSQTRDLPIALSVADCVPVILAATDKVLVGVIHVSWRSLNAGIIEKAFALLKSPTKVIAAIGPCIGLESYEVQDDFVQELNPELKKFLKKFSKKQHFDLQAATVNELKKLGVSEIDVANIDTYTHTDEFYSYRREGECGRFGAIVSL